MAAIIFFSVLAAGGMRNATARAATEIQNSSAVLNELEKDSNFNASDYVSKSDDYSIYVIQIAESRNGNIYVYTYQPCQQSRELKATSINMSLTRDAADTKMYSLEMVNQSGVFVKYRVSGVQSDTAENSIHYYNVTAIYRGWDKEIDGESGNNNKINSKAYAVKNIYLVIRENGNVTYYREPTYVVNILNPYVDYLLYSRDTVLPAGGSFITFDKANWIDSFYVAFSTDWDIDKLLSADVHYYSRSVSGKVTNILGNKKWVVGGDYSATAWAEQTAYLNYTDRFEDSGKYLLGFLPHSYSYSWNRIQSASDFVKGEANLTAETQENLADKQWVLRFAEFERTQENDNYLIVENVKVNYTEVERVTILRLEFETDGVVYNLGAVMDEMTDDGFAGNAEYEDDEGWFGWISSGNCSNCKGGTVIFWVVLIIVIIVLLPVLAVLLPTFGKILLALLKAVWWVICLPYKIIRAIVRKIKSKNAKNK